MKTIKLMIGVALGAALLAGCEQSNLKTSPEEWVETMKMEEVVSGWAKPQDKIYDSLSEGQGSILFGGFVDADRISLLMRENTSYVPVYYKVKPGHKISISYGTSGDIVIEILETKSQEDAIRIKVSKVKEGE
ncbi:hypothetical protein JMA_38970 (plasmid) [Jeotgalibacillus malaysiensis]|uniref:Lipoprotein n=1 Tax=Jeotgalibacillus malaysiensis TaxID=1508404 RepID=A0A0B5ASM4_9BACL|nr:hypothetical protein [Jeotgalibacillus malaysiensis]AJD93215.1 hypothetical protein JMA_38970 [Jeotgalibacillus malaysiensis]